MKILLLSIALLICSMSLSAQIRNTKLDYKVQTELNDKHLQTKYMFQPKSLPQRLTLCTLDLNFDQVVLTPKNKLIVTTSLLMATVIAIPMINDRIKGQHISKTRYALAGSFVPVCFAMSINELIN